MTAIFKSLRSPFVFCFYSAFILDLFITRNWIIPHAPLSDDLSMIAFSRTWSWDWLNKGLADYFIVYPEYYGPQSNFIRPVCNFLYWLFATLIPFDAPFLDNKIQLVALTYGMHALVCAFLFTILQSISRSWLIAGSGLIASFAIPAFWTTPTPTYSSFVFDGLSVLFCLVAFVANEKQRFVSMSLALILALWTKEIALPIIFGFLIFFLIHRQWRRSFGPVLALLLWGGLRLNGFGLHTEGVYVFGAEAQTLSVLLIEKLHNALSLPIGPVFLDQVFKPTGVEIMHRDGLLLILNLTIYAMIATVFIRYIGTASGVMKRLPEYRSRISLAGIIVVLSFLFDAYIGANYRYAFNLLPFLFIAIAGIQTHIAFRQIMLALLALGSIIASSSALQRLNSGSEFEIYRYHVMRELFDTLRQYPDRKNIIIMNDFVLGYANPKALEILLPYSGKIIRGTSLYLDSCERMDIKAIATNIINSDGVFRISGKLPACARFTFESSPKLDQFVTGNQILRNADIHYEFEPQVGASAGIASWTGRDLTAIIRNADILYFDFTSDHWIFMKNSAL